MLLTCTRQFPLSVQIRPLEEVFFQAFLLQLRLQLLHPSLEQALQQRTIPYIWQRRALLDKIIQSQNPLYTVKKESNTKTIMLPVAVAFQTLAFTNSIHRFVSILFNIQKLTQNRTATAETPAMASISSRFAPEISMMNSAINQVTAVAPIAITIP